MSPQLLALNIILGICLLTTLIGALVMHWSESDEWGWWLLVAFLLAMTLAQVDGMVEFW